MMSDPAPNYLDGNAAAGVLASLFVGEMTAAIVTCAGCNATGPLATLRNYCHGMGLVLRCPGCDTAVIRLTVIDGQHRIDLRGIAQLRCGRADG